MRDYQRLLSESALSLATAPARGELESPDEPPAVWATWSCWWGSPQLVAQLARKARSAVAAVGPRAEPAFEIALTVGDDVEHFESADAFLVGASPEALARFELLELRVRGNGVDLRVGFERPKRSRLGGGRGQLVRLDVSTSRPSLHVHACEVGRAVAISIRRGYARYWAGSASALELREQVGRSLPAHDLITMVVTLAVGALLGAGLARLLAILPGVTLSSQVAIGILAVAGMGYPLLVTQVVPNVEVAPAGRTRVIYVARRTAVALATFAATHLAQLIFE